MALEKAWIYTAQAMNKLLDRLGMAISLEEKL